MYRAPQAEPYRTPQATTRVPAYPAEPTVRSEPPGRNDAATAMGAPPARPAVPIYDASPDSSSTPSPARNASPPSDGETASYGAGGPSVGGDFPPEPPASAPPVGQATGSISAPAQ